MLVKSTEMAEKNEMDHEPVILAQQMPNNPWKSNNELRKSSDQLQNMMLYIRYLLI